MRWWNGTDWTGDTEAAPPTVPSPPAAESPPLSAVQRSPMTEQTLFVSQQRKLVELTNQYAIFAADGGQIGPEIGSLNAENWRAWNFSIQDAAGTEVARITKTWEGLLTTLFTTADTYLVQIHRPLAEPLHSLVVASALTVDTALKQDSRGFN